MSDLNPYTLSAEAKARWSERLNAALKQAGSSQKAVATELNPEQPLEKKIEVNRFVNADPKVLKRWFTQRPEWVRAFADEVKWEPAELTALLEALLTAREGGEALWHARFPELGAVGVEIPAPMVGERGESPDEVVKSVVGPQAVKHPAGVRLILGGPAHEYLKTH